MAIPPHPPSPAFRFAACALLGLLFPAGNPVHAQDGVDTVIVLREPGSPETAERKGRIASWTGNELVLETSGGSRRIAGELIVAIRTSWSTEAESGRAALRACRWDDAAVLISQAIGIEPRPWAQAELRADLVRLFDLNRQTVRAGREFLSLLADDPSTRHYPAIPLAWETSLVNPEIEQFAEQCLAVSSPAAQLLGASWLLGTSRRDAALETLQRLGRDIEPRIAHLAAAQLWRTRWMTIDGAELQRWEEQLGRMPMPLRPGPLLILAEAQARLGRTDDAVLSLLSVPVIHSEHLAARRAALRRAAAILEASGRAAEARRVADELHACFPDSRP